MHALIITFNNLVTTRHKLMVRSLKSRGWTITFLGWDRGEGRSKSEDYRDLIDEFHWVNLPAPTWSRKILARLPQYYHRLQQTLSATRDPNLVIITHIALLPWASWFSCPKIYDSFEFFSLGMASYFGPLEQLVWPLWRKLEALLVKQVDGVTTVDSRGDCLGRFFRQSVSNVQTIMNLSSRSDDPGSAAVEALKKKYASRQVIAFVGGRMTDRGLRVALEAAALVKDKHPDSLFIFIGTLEDDPAMVSHLIASHRLESHTLFLQWMHYREMLAHLHHCRIGLILYQPERNKPYVGSGGGRKSFTYMQAGIPIVAPDFGDIGAIIKEEHCGILTDSTSSAAVAQGIMHLLENPETAAAMGRRGREAFLRKYNWELEEKKFLNFVEKIVNNGLD